MKRVETEDAEDTREVVLNQDQMDELFFRLDKSLKAHLEGWLKAHTDSLVKEKIDETLRQKTEDSIKLELIKKMVD